MFVAVVALFHRFTLTEPAITKLRSTYIVIASARKSLFIGIPEPTRLVKVDIHLQFSGLTTRPHDSIDTYFNYV
jgi:hypothetical protein